MGESPWKFESSRPHQYPLKTKDSLADRSGAGRRPLHHMRACLTGFDANGPSPLAGITTAMTRRIEMLRQPRSRPHGSQPPDVSETRSRPPDEPPETDLQAEVGELDSCPKSHLLAALRSDRADPIDKTWRMLHTGHSLAGPTELRSASSASRLSQW